MFVVYLEGEGRTGRGGNYHVFGIIFAFDCHYCVKRFWLRFLCVARVWGVNLYRSEEVGYGNRVAVMIRSYCGWEWAGRVLLLSWMPDIYESLGVGLLIGNEGLGCRLTL